MGRKNKGKQVLTDSNSVRFFWITRTFAVVRETADRAPPTPEGHRLPEFCRQHARSRLWQRRSARLSLETSISNRKGRSCCLYPDTGETYYRHWLATLENLVAEKGVATSETLHRYRDAWDHAADRTPHGAPIELMPGDFG